MFFNNELKTTGILNNIVALCLLCFSIQKIDAQSLFIAKEKFKHEDYIGCYKDLQQNRLSQEASILKLKCLVKLDSVYPAYQLAHKLYKTTHIDTEMELLGDVFKNASVMDTALVLYQKSVKINNAKFSSLKERVQKKIQQIYNFKEISKIQGNIHVTNLGTMVNKTNRQYYPQLKHDTLLFYNDYNFPVSERIKKYHVIEGTIKTVDLTLKDPLTDFKDLYIIGSSSKSDYVLVNVLHKSVDFYTLKLCKYNAQTNSIDEVANLNEQLSKSLSDESSAYISNDGEQIVFSSNRKGGFGGYDIYVSRILPNGEFSNPKNLGSTVNTEANEEFPVLSSDGKKLYFSSDGHTSIGGYDLFMSDFDSLKNNFVNVRNMGIDVNTLGDNLSITITTSGRTGYTSGIYKIADNYGDDDIYELTFNDAEENTIILIGQTYNANVNSIEITKPSNGDLVGIYKTNANNGKFVSALTPGNYDLLFITDDDEVKQRVTIPNKPNLSEINMDFKLK